MLARAGQLPSPGLVCVHSLVWFLQANCKSPADVLKLVRFQEEKMISRFPVSLKTIADSALSYRVRLLGDSGSLSA